jgi:hypothetical protein
MLAMLLATRRGKEQMGKARGGMWERWGGVGGEVWMVEGVG